MASHRLTDGDDVVDASPPRPTSCCVALDPDGREPLRRQLAAELRAAIRAGRLRAGVRLPASRALAQQLGVSRGVVTDAYEQLTAEGWLASRQGAGTTVVGDALEPAPPARPRRRRPSAPGASTSRRPRPTSRSSRAALWAKAVARAAAAAPDAALDYQDGHGRIELREALAGHLGRVRGTACDPADIVVTAGLQPGDRAAVRAARRARRAPDRLRGPVAARPLGGGRARRAARPSRSRSTATALRADALADAGADAVVITPSHQFPTGRRDGRGAAPRAARVGARGREADRGGRLRRRVPLRPAAARGAPGARPGARRLPRHGVQDARAGAAAGLGARAARARRRAGRGQARRGLRLPRARPARAGRALRVRGARAQPARRAPRLR